MRKTIRPPDTIGDCWPLTIDVRLPDGRVVTVSAFCPICGWRRMVAGHPGQAFVGSGARASARFVAWMNPCGHVDTAEALAVEESLQCAAPGCVVLASDGCFPFCTPECCAEVSGCGCVSGQCWARC